MKILNKFDSSRKLQNAQHLTGGIYNIFLMLIGLFFGKGDVTMGIVMTILTIIVSRISSEISYQTSIRVIKEYSNGTNYDK